MVVQQVRVATVAAPSELKDTILETARLARMHDVGDGPEIFATIFASPSVDLSFLNMSTPGPTIHRPDFAVGAPASTSQYAANAPSDHHLVVKLRRRLVVKPCLA